jgi:hypothetical protein
MNNEMAVITTSAPITITTAFVPLRPLLLDELPVVVTWGAVVVVDGTEFGDAGKPGESAFPAPLVELPEPSAAAGQAANATNRTTTARTRTSETLPLRG